MIFRLLGWLRQQIPWWLTSVQSQNLHQPYGVSAGILQNSQSRSAGRLLEQDVISRTRPSSSVGSPLFMSWRSVHLAFIKEEAVDRTTGPPVTDIRVTSLSVGTPDPTTDAVASAGIMILPPTYESTLLQLSQLELSKSTSLPYNQQCRHRCSPGWSNSHMHLNVLHCGHVIVQRYELGCLGSSTAVSSASAGISIGGSSTAWAVAVRYSPV